MIILFNLFENDYFSLFQTFELLRYSCEFVYTCNIWVKHENLIWWLLERLYTLKSVFDFRLGRHIQRNCPNKYRFVSEFLSATSNSNDFYLNLVSELPGFWFSHCSNASHLIITCLLSATMLFVFAVNSKLLMQIYLFSYMHLFEYMHFSYYSVINLYFSKII